MIVGRDGSEAWSETEMRREREGVKIGLLDRNGKGLKDSRMQIIIQMVRFIISCK